MKTFPNPLITRDLMIADMVAHREAYQLIAGSYGETSLSGEFRGCAVGCSIHTINRVLQTHHRFGDHDALADLIGVPEELMRLQDRVFEKLPAKDRVFWPERFYRSIPDGSDQSDTPRRINIRILREIALPAIIVDQWRCRDALSGVADALESGSKAKIKAARTAAYACVDGAHVAADAAADGAADGAWRQVADIVCQEMTKCGAGA